MKIKALLTATACSAAFALPTTASAAVFSFTSTLSGEQHTPAADTDATGTATLSVDDSAQTLTFSLNVIGISLDDLWDTLVEAPVGPIHLHDGDVGANGPVVVPFAFDLATYSDTATGFSLLVSDYAYSDAAATSGTTLSFANYLADLQAGGSYINVHTDAFNGGEIRGQLAPVPLPAGFGLGLLGLAGLAALRRRA